MHPSCMVEKKYSQVSLPKVITDQVDKEIKLSKNGYRSRAEFVIEAVREKLRKLQPREVPA